MTTRLFYVLRHTAWFIYDANISLGHRKPPKPALMFKRHNADIVYLFNKRMQYTYTIQTDATYLWDEQCVLHTATVSSTITWAQMIMLIIY